MHFGCGIGEIHLLRDGCGISSGEHHFAGEGEGLCAGAGVAERSGIGEHGGVEAGGDLRGDGRSGGDGEVIDKFRGGSGRGDDVVDVGEFGEAFVMIDIDGEQR